MIEFTKMHGLGNDYLFIDGYTQTGLESDASELARRMSDRRRGVGADGIILVLPPRDGGDVRMRIFNADGSEAEMCGNGIRCLCRFVRDRGLSSARPLAVETGAGIRMLEEELDDTGRVAAVTVDMGAPVFEPARIPVDLAGDRIVDHPLDPIASLLDGADDLRLSSGMTCVSMGNPHLVLFCENAGSIAIAAIGPRLEHASIFPNRINVHFVEVVSPDEVVMRTWERGSGATDACGTGAAAVVAAGVETGRTVRRILAHLPGGDLQLHYDGTTGRVTKRGPVAEVFSGRWERAAGPLGVGLVPA